MNVRSSMRPSFSGHVASAQPERPVIPEPLEQVTGECGRYEIGNGGLSGFQLTGET